MAEFYEQMLQHGMTPSAALRSAKLKLMRDKRWIAPYYWAGFVVQGEYTNHIKVAQHIWLRIGLAILSFLILLAAAGLTIKRRKRSPSTEQAT
jgi:hypothetical protein